MATNTYNMTGGSGFQGAGPGQRTNPVNDAFGGGSLTRAGNPVAVGGAFTGVGATGGPPPSFGTPAAAYARNDRGSNIRIPYARVVSMHARDSLPVEDPGLTGTGRTTAYEYDGLEPSELAWIMSKQFSLKPSAKDGNGVYQPQGTTSGFAPIASAIDVSSFGGNVQKLSQSGLAAGGNPIFGVRGADGAVIVPSAGMGGAGVNRMERLAYTRWVEALFKHKIGRQAINLCSATISSDTTDIAGDGSLRGTDNYNAALDSEIEFWSRCWSYPDYDPEYDQANATNTQNGPAAGASLFAVPDIAYMLQKVMPNRPLQVGVPMMQGLYIMEKGPFLRSYGTEHEPVHCEIANHPDRAGYGRKLQVEADRHIGSDLAQRALVCELKKAGLLNWTPDGICLSKDHSGQSDVSADPYFDARLGQLFNIAVQGPTITKTWSSLGQTEGINAASSDIVTMPMDKVFILIVGELSYEIEDGPNEAAKKAAELTKLTAKQSFTPVTVNDDPLDANKGNQVRGTMTASILGGTMPKTADAAAQAAAAEARNKVVDEMTDEMTQIAQTSILGDRSELFVAYDAAMKAVAAAERPAAGSTAIEQAALKGTADRKLEDLKKLITGPKRENVAGDAFKAEAKKLRSGKSKVVKAELMNFRLMRATSSYLANKSHFKPGDERSRCGLKIGCEDDGKKGNAEYILGGWCIGTVCDSAASRALGHNGIRSAPSTYAINVNVNVEWWNPDQLYSHYQDKERDAANATSEGTTYMRTISPYRTIGQVAKERFGDSSQVNEAIDLLRFGVNKDKNVGDVEGLVKEPNLYGADTDPTKIGKPGRDGYQIPGEAGTDDRVWVEAGETAARITDYTSRHLKAVRGEDPAAAAVTVGFVP